MRYLYDPSRGDEIWLQIAYDRCYDYYFGVDVLTKHQIKPILTHRSEAINAKEPYDEIVEMAKRNDIFYKEFVKKYERAQIEKDMIQPWNER